MKKLILFSLFTMFLMSCGTTTGDPEVDTISIGLAFSIVSKSWSYWLFIAIPVVVFGYYIYRKSKSDDGWAGTSLLPIFGFVAVIMFAIFFRPCEIAANTSIAAYQRGNIIGY